MQAQASSSERIEHARMISLFVFAGKNLSLAFAVLAPEI